MKKRTRKNPPKRGDGQTTMSVSLPADLKDRLTELAAAQGRSRSNYLTTVLEALVELEAEGLDAAKEALA
jgi:predicted transcriptional regulator